MAARVRGDGGSIVGFVCHQQDGGVRVGGNGKVQVRAAEGDIVDAAEKDVRAAVVDANVLVDEQRQAIGLHMVADDAGADDGIVIAEDAEAEGAGEGAEELGAAGRGGKGDIDRHGAAAGEVAGNEQEVGLERVNLMDDAAQKEILGVLLEVDIGDLDEAKTIEGSGKIAQEESALDELNLMPGPLIGVESDGGDRGEGTGDKGAAGEQGRGSRLVELGHAVHRSS